MDRQLEPQLVRLVHDDEQELVFASPCAPPAPTAACRAAGTGVGVLRHASASGVGYGQIQRRMRVPASARETHRPWRREQCPVGFPGFDAVRYVRSVNRATHAARRRSGGRGRACARGRGSSCRPPARAPRRGGGCRHWRRRGARAPLRRGRAACPDRRSATRRLSTTRRPPIMTLATAVPSSVWTSWLTGSLSGSQFGWSRSSMTMSAL